MRGRVGTPRWGHFDPLARCTLTENEHTWGSTLCRTRHERPHTLGTHWVGYHEKIDALELGIHEIVGKIARFFALTPYIVALLLRSGDYT